MHAGEGVELPEYDGLDMVVRVRSPRFVRLWGTSMSAVTTQPASRTPNH